MSLPTRRKVEEIALREAMHWARRHATMSVTFETDLEVQRACQKSETDESEFGRIIEDYKLVLCDQPRDKVVLVTKDGNRVAHALARHLFYLARTIMGDAPPDWLVTERDDICLLH
ncbi:hypothetical protein LINPERHAP1_LOCUS15082 [Linum perenne]